MLDQFGLVDADATPGCVATRCDHTCRACARRHGRPSTGLNQPETHSHGARPVIRVARDRADRQRVFRFRYQVYVEEMRRIQKYADHDRRTVEEPLDATGHILVAELGDTVVGTVRTNFGDETDFGYYADLFSMRAVGDAFPGRVSLTTKLMVAPALRSGTLAVRVAQALFSFGQARGNRHDFIDCNAHLEDFFLRMGYRLHGPKVDHPEYGTVQPMRLDVMDVEHLRAVRSPLPAALMRLRDRSVASSDPFTHSKQPIESKAIMQTAQPSSVVTESANPPLPGAGRGKSSIIQWLDARIAELLGKVEQAEFWKTLTSPTSDPALLRGMMKELYLEIFSYQTHAIEGAITAIAQMPRSMPVRMIKAMLRHQAEEFDHGEMALRDYVALGGSEQFAREEHRTSPAAYSVAALWRMIADQRDPFAYLGALYPFEGLTPIVSERAKAALLKRGFPAAALEFVEFHSTEDPKHTELVKALIEETVTRYPEAERSIQEGLERFLAIYPIPVWETAYRRALANHLSGSANARAA